MCGRPGPGREQTDSKDTDEGKAYTTKTEKYTNEEGKKKKRTVVKNSYVYKIVKEDIKVHCTFVYQIVDTQTGESLETDELEANRSDRVNYVNWNGYDGVRPSDLYRRASSGKYKSLDTSLFDTRMMLQDKWELYSAANDHMSAQLIETGLGSLGAYRPSSQPGVAASMGE